MKRYFSFISLDEEQPQLSLGILLDSNPEMFITKM